MDKTEASVRAAIALILLTAFGIGGMKGFVPALVSVLFFLFGLALLVGVIWLIVRSLKKRPAATSDISKSEPSAQYSSALQLPKRENSSNMPRVVWTSYEVEQALEKIDWFQFEKFCEALFSAEGFQVDRKGGAHPDGGVDLVVSKDGLSALIQCKHWKTWQVQEKVVRELLGSMTHFGVQQAAIFCLRGGTEPARNFAAQHEIDIVDAAELGKRAVAMLGTDSLNRVLDSRSKHCPKCESPMVERNGKFGPFWGCSQFPRCRGKLEVGKAP
ncbi:restriction endonuclease [Synoicihabitans lomoniglobus]|uniref:Restriction endonuclease n=1 Tax=Synoicihabitans lomoniglobus TaxID=2909285 RepID=A0AAF0CSM4_9BACT|nr:restriction endonuclease [Opitutaceae bacterium LMO-M01]WED67293.1 restriction endonuclease [Opitutaceae bacterium LMO-M01]